VLGVYLAFFAVGIIAAALLLGGRTADLRDTGSWGVYMPAAVNILAEIGLALAVVFLLGARRGVRPSTLGFRVPRLADGRVAVSQSVRVMGWCFFAIILGGMINAALQTGSLPAFHNSPPALIYAMFDSLQAGFVEEVVVLAFVVVTLRQAGRPWWEVTVVALVLRGAYHIYYGPGVVGILVWAALFYWIYLRFRQLWPMIICHTLWDAVAFLSRPVPAVAGVGFLLVLILWVVCLILWLVSRNNQPTPAYLPGGAGPWWPGAHGGVAPGRGGPGWGSSGGVTGWPPVPVGPGGSGGSGGPGGSWWPASTAGDGRAWTGTGPAAPTTQAGPVGAPGPVGGPPPSWYPDPAGHNRWRWWDGQRWTDHVSTHS
jgi:hypothetical protein